MSPLFLPGKTVEDGPNTLVSGNPQISAETRRPMAETLPKEGISVRLAEIRGQLKLLSDYL
jgi:hypothetical protein